MNRSYKYHPPPPYFLSRHPKSFSKKERAALSDNKRCYIDRDMTEPWCSLFVFWISLYEVLCLYTKSQALICSSLKPANVQQGINCKTASYYRKIISDRVVWCGQFKAELMWPTHNHCLSQSQLVFYASYTTANFQNWHLHIVTCNHNCEADLFLVLFAS